MDEVEASGLSPRALRAIALMGVASVALAAGIGVYLWTSAPHLPPVPPPPVTSQPIPISMDWFTAREGWLVVHDAGGPESVLFRTTDGGAHWQREVPVGGPSSVRFTDARHGIVRIYAFGRLQVLRTTDGGAHWTPLALPAPASTGAAVPFFLDDTTGWLLSRPSLYRTVDGGRHWRELPDVPGDPVDLSFATTGTGWATSGSSAATLLVTHDGGQDWTGETVPTGPSGPHPGDQLDIAPPVTSRDGHGVLAVNDRSGGQGWVYVSEDDGATWLDPRPLPWAGGDTWPAFVDSRVGWTWSGGLAWVTTDSGRTWRSAGGPLGWTFNSLTPVSATAAWATGSMAVAQGSVHLVIWGLFHTTDAGQHWTRTPLPNLG